MKEIYRSRYNYAKYIEVRRYADGHYVWRQILMWENGKPRNLSKLVRVRKDFMHSVIDGGYDRVLYVHDRYGRMVKAEEVL